MSATYDPIVPTDKDWVRLLAGDRGTPSTGTTVTGTVLSDEEIAAILVEETNKYLAAARAGDIILAAGGDVVSKSVGDLSLSFGHSSPTSAYRAHLDRLRAKGAAEVSSTTGKSSVLRML